MHGSPSISVLIISGEAIMLRCIMKSQMLPMSTQSNAPPTRLTTLAPSNQALVGAVMYYTVLALALFGGLEMPGAVLVLAYLLPVAAHIGRVVGQAGSKAPAKPSGVPSPANARAA